MNQSKADNVYKRLFAQGMHSVNTNDRIIGANNSQNTL